RSEQWVTNAVGGVHKGEGTLWHTFDRMAPVALTCDINADDKQSALGVGKRVVIAQVSKTATLSDHIETGEIVNCILWQPGTLNVICGDDKGNVRVVNTKSKLIVFKYTPHKGAEVTALAYHPRTNFIATAGGDKRITLYSGKI